MFLSKRKTGIYYICYRDELTGKIIRKSTKTKDKTRVQKLLSDYRGKKSEEDKNKFFTLASLRYFVLDYVKNNFTNSTHQLYRRAFREYISILGNKIAYDVTPEDIEYFKHKRLSTVSPVTLNIEIRNLKTSYNLARKFNQSAYNPFKDIEQIKEVQRKKVILTEDEIEKLINVIDIQLLKYFVLIGLYTGMRIAEILNLQWKDILLDEKIIKVLNKVNHSTGQIK